MGLVANALLRRHAGQAAVKIAALLILLSIPAVAQPVQVISVYDGDTLKVMLGGQPTKIRVANLDAPEIGSRSRCAAEADIGNRSAAMARTLVGSVVTIHIDAKRPFDKYRRTLATVELQDGTDLAARLIEAGLGRPWRGKSSDWCADK